MNCEEVIPLTHAYSDGELDLVRALELEKHLADCPACSQACEEVKSVKKAVRAADLYYPAPAELKRQVRDSFREPNPGVSGASFPWWHLLKWAIPVTGLAIVALLLVPWVLGQSADERLAQEVTSAHVRSLMAEHKTDVASSDQHTVKPWFQGKLDFTPPVADLADHGFPLVGGRLDYLQGHPVAALVYQRHRHFINLFVWPAGPGLNLSEHWTVRQGYNLVHWTASGMTCWAVSDLNRAELADLVRLIK